VNSINLIGNLTRDPDTRETKGGTTVCSMRLAVSARGNGDPVYLDVVAFDRQAEVCDEYLKKGRAVAVSGRLGYSECESDGCKRSKHRKKGGLMARCAHGTRERKRRLRHLAAAAAARPSQQTRGEDLHRTGTVQDVSETLRLTAVFDDAGDGWILVRVRELPEVITQGATPEEARAMLRSAVRDWLSFYVADQGGTPPDELPPGIRSEPLELTIA
jgi:single-strand DNA-binding protein